MGKIKGKTPLLKLDFNKPDDARRFMRNVRMPNGARIEKVWTKDGKEVDLDSATDDQITQYASQIYEELFEPYQGKPGAMYYEEDLLQ